MPLLQLFVSPLSSLPVVNSTLKRWKRGIMVIIAWHQPDFGIIFAFFLQKWCQNQALIPTFNYHNAAPMVLFCFGGMVASHLMVANMQYMKPV